MSSMSQQLLPPRQWIVGNWKMYKTSEEALEYWKALIPELQGLHVDVGFAVPYTLIAASASIVAPLGIAIGAQNMHDASQGSFTGEIAASMLCDAGASFVILGHSERRRLFGETNEWIHKKVLRAIQSQLQIILCVGESLEEHEAGKTHEILEEQLEVCLADVLPDQLEKMAIAYEPVWAVGSGQPATVEQIENAHLFLREWLSKKIGKEQAENVRLLYGGSVQAKNAALFLTELQVDGLLVGGSSLSPALFSAILRAAPSLEQRQKQCQLRRLPEHALHIEENYEQMPQQEGSL